MNQLFLTVLLAVFYTCSVSVFTPDNFTDLLKSEIKYLEFAKEKKNEGIVVMSCFDAGGGLFNIEQTKTSIKANSTHNMKFLFQLV